MMIVLVVVVDVVVASDSAVAFVVVCGGTRPASVLERNRSINPSL